MSLRILDTSPVLIVTTPYIVNRSVGIAYLQPVEEPDAVSPTTLDTSERIQALHTQLDQLQEELTYLAKNPPREGLIGKRVGLGLFAISFVLVLVVFVFAFVLAMPDFWQGILGGAVILAVLGIIFYGDGKKTYATVCTRYHQRYRDSPRSPTGRRG
jgi:hypothetical protein